MSREVVVPRLASGGFSLSIVSILCLYGPPTKTGMGADVGWDFGPTEICLLDSGKISVCPILERSLFRVVVTAEYRSAPNSFFLALVPHTNTTQEV